MDSFLNTGITRGFKKKIVLMSLGLFRSSHSGPGVQSGVRGLRERWEAGGGEGLPTPPRICIHTGSLPRLSGASGPKVLMGPSCPSPVGKPLGSPVQKPTPHRSISTKVLLAEGEDTPFAEHCRHYEDSYRVRGARDLWAGEDPTPSSPRGSGHPGGPPWCT